MSEEPIVDEQSVDDPVLDEGLEASGDGGDDANLDMAKTR